MQVDGSSRRELDELLRRNRALGNAVCPPQAKYAFSVLSGLLPYIGPELAVRKSRSAKGKPKSKLKPKRKSKRKPKKKPKSKSKSKPKSKSKTQKKAKVTKHTRRAATTRSRTRFEPDPVPTRHTPNAASASSTGRYNTRTRAAQEQQVAEGQKT